jgi:hypothetical protein
VVRYLWIGPWLPRVGPREGEEQPWGATGSVGDFAVRLVQRNTTPTHGLTSPEPKRRRPTGENCDSVTAGAFGTNRRAARGRKCLHGLSGVTPDLHRHKPGTSVLGYGGDRRGDQPGESQTLENGWIQRVLVDNKSVAEIGEKHLVCHGSARFGERAQVRPARPGVPSP